MSDGVPCMWMRGGTSKGGYFLAEDLPTDKSARDAQLLSIMGSPDPRQIDGMGGGDPLTSKVAVISRSRNVQADVDYLFLQVSVDEALVSDAQNCGNILAGVGPFAIERGLVAAASPKTQVRIFMKNTGQIATATVETAGGSVCYSGNAHIDGVAGRHAAIPLEFQDIAGSSCGALLPTGNACDTVEGVDCTLIDNGMPCVVMRAAAFGLSGKETPAEIDRNDKLKNRIETIRLAAGRVMNLGDVAKKTVPKMTLVSAPSDGATIATRTLIPHRCHKAIGVFGAVSVATACLIEGSIADGLARVPQASEKHLSIQHPTGEMTVIATMKGGEIARIAILRTARKLFDGIVFPYGQT